MDKTNSQSDLSARSRLTNDGNALEEPNPAMTPQIARAPSSLDQQANENSAGKRYSLRSLRCESIEAGPAEHQQAVRVSCTPRRTTNRTSDRPCKPRWNNAVSMLLELASDAGDRVVFRFLDDALNEVAHRSARELSANA
ncbi:MAG TPA: hypothetical protein VMV81_01235, partial [Phycisphaerae bacterium]|nr:hypothetical protein [Phycisphaerae bacterium]